MAQLSKTSSNRRRLCMAAPIAVALSGAAFAATPPSVPGSPGIGPLKLDDIRLSFGIPEAGPTTKFVKPDEALPSFKAVIRYAGGGTIAGRWELVSPADATPDETSILPEAQMSASERGRLRRFELLESFSTLLPALLGTHTISGPNLPADTLKLIGAYRIVLRIEAVSSAGNAVTQKRLPMLPLKLHLLGGPTPLPVPVPAPVATPTN